MSIPLVTVNLVIHYLSRSKTFTNVNFILSLALGQQSRHSFNRYKQLTGSTIYIPLLEIASSACFNIKLDLLVEWFCISLPLTCTISCYACWFSNVTGGLSLDNDIFEILLPNSFRSIHYERRSFIVQGDIPKPNLTRWTRDKITNVQLRSNYEELSPFPLSNYHKKNHYSRHTTAKRRVL